jgi:hypothetical protein
MQNGNCLVCPESILVIDDTVMIVQVLRREVSRRLRFSQTLVKSSAPSHETRFCQSHQGGRRDGPDNKLRPSSGSSSSSSSSMLVIARIHESIVVHCSLNIWMKNAVVQVYSRSNLQRFATDSRVVITSVILKITFIASSALRNTIKRYLDHQTTS